MQGCRNPVKNEEKQKPRFLFFAVEKGQDGFFQLLGSQTSAAERRFFLAAAVLTATIYGV